MSPETLIKSFFTGFFSLCLAWRVFSSYDSETGTESRDGDRRRYQPNIPGCLLPACLLTLAVATTFLLGPHTTAEMMLSLCFSIFLHISLYYLALMAALPFLRRHINARACAMLWMLPNYLYITQQSFMAVPFPLLVIRVPQRFVWTLFYIWIICFLFVMAWKTLSHLLFRSRILKGAADLTDSEALEIWNREKELAGLNYPKHPPVISPNASTPLSIGLFHRTTRVVLPPRAYSPDELGLIFRHEIVHIGREDAWTKFFLSFCTAMCWFNPLMWAAAKRSADDLELSCDETVLLGCEEDIRHQYASLILATAEDEHGFTTCLFASASAMRYRLKHIMKPKMRHSGALTVGAVFFILCMSCGYVALAYSETTGEEAIYGAEDHDLCSVHSIMLTDGPYRTFECTDMEAFHEYMSGLVMDRLTGNYSFADSEKEFTFLYDTPQGSLAVVLSDYVVKLVPLYEERPSPTYYYLPEGVDWEFLDTIIAPSKNQESD